MFEIQIPYYIVNLMEKLENAGFEAYVTGGCIRDSLLGIKPSDWDMCTSAAPYDMKRVFSDMKIVLIGEKHGTVTVVTDESSVEITSFRKDGCYSDARHPDNVDFVTDIKEDLARRDFTVNAMAYGKTAGIIDLYGGREDLYKPSKIVFETFTRKRSLVRTQYRPP